MVASARLLASYSCLARLDSTPHACPHDRRHARSLICRYLCSHRHSRSHRSPCSISYRRSRTLSRRHHPLVHLIRSPSILHSHTHLHNARSHRHTCSCESTLSFIMHQCPRVHSHRHPRTLSHRRHSCKPKHSFTPMLSIIVMPLLASTRSHGH